MTVKINQLTVKGTLDAKNNSTDKEVLKKSNDKEFDALKKYVDARIENSLDKLCDSTVRLIIDELEKKSKY